MDISKNNLVFNHDYTKGHFDDYSGNGNDASQASDSFIKGENGWGSVPSLGTLSIPHDASQNISALTFIIHADFYRLQNSGDRMLYKAGAYDFYFASTTSIAFSDGTTAYSFSGVYDYVGAKTIAITKSTGSSKAKLYIDGVFVVEAGGNTEIGTSSNTLYVGNAIGVANQLDVPMFGAVLYSDEKSAEEVSMLHKAIIKRKTKFKRKRNFSTLPSVPALSSGLGINMQILNGTIHDQGPGRIAFTNLGHGNMNSETVWGETAVKMDGTQNAGFATGVISNFDFGDNPWGAFIWVKNLNTTRRLILQNGLINTDGFTLEKTASETLKFELHDPGGNTSVTSSKVLLDGVWHLVGIYSEGSSGDIYIYLDGEQDSNTAAGQALVANSNAFRIGDYQAGGLEWDGEIGPFPRIDEFATKELFEAALKSEWNRVANKVIHYEDFSDAFLLQSAISGAGSPIPGTEYKVNSISGQIVSGPNLGDKSISGAALGAITETPAPDHAFGRFVIDFEAVAGSRCRFNLIEGAVFSIADFGGTTSTISIIPSAGGGMTGAAGGLSAGEHQAIIDKKANLSSLNTTLYIDGTLEPAATGSNPYTDLTNVVGVRQLAPYGVAKIHKVIQYFGVPIE